MKTSATPTADQIDAVFTTLKNELVQLVDAGSVIVDEIGSGADYDFAFVNDIDKLQVTVGGVALDKEAIVDENGEPAYGFGKSTDANETTNYQFVVTYCKNGCEYEGNSYGECFVCKINVPVTVDQQVKLNYTVKLTDPKAEAGTYEGLYTNNSATLFPVDTTGTHGTAEEFPKPTVSYTVEAVPTPSPATDPTPAPTPTPDEHPEIGQAIKEGTWGKPQPTAAPASTPAPAAKVTSTHIPQTGDASNPAIWAAVMAAALAAFVAVALLRRRGNKS